MTVTRAEVDAWCDSLPGTRMAHPPELVSWKVGEKMFACFGGEADMSGVSVKTRDAETAAMLIDAGVATRAPYFHRSWIRFPFDSADPEELRHRLFASYDLIRASLPAKLRHDLPPREEAS